MQGRFVVIDVETANPWFGSICQIGLALYEGGGLQQSDSLLIDPGDEFDEFNIAIHGIRPEDVRGKPTLEAVLPMMRQVFDSVEVVASYGHFDRTALSQACEEVGRPLFDHPWLNLHSVVRRAWPEESSQEGVALKKVCRRLGIDLRRHHDAQADAIAAGEVFLAAIRHSGLDHQSWMRRVRQPVLPGTGSGRGVKDFDVNPDGVLAGEGIVFTGALSISRDTARQAAAELGCKPLSGITKKTTMLVVGDQDIRKLGGRKKSSKHQKAEDAIAAGQNIRILGESDFMAMLKMARQGAIG